MSRSKKEKNNNKGLVRMVRKRKAIKCLSDSSSDEADSGLHDILYGSENDDNCAQCGENYFKSRLVEDWIQCIVCNKWVHENCSEFDDMCSKCGQKKKKEAKRKDMKRKGKGKGEMRSGHLARSILTRSYHIAS